MKLNEVKMKRKRELGEHFLNVRHEWRLCEILNEIMRDSGAFILLYALIHENAGGGGGF